MDGVKEIMRAGPWNTEKRIPWPEIRATWEKSWDLTKPILVEKSPPNIARAFEIEAVFKPAYFVAMIRDPYALCESINRRLGHDVEAAARKWVMHAEY